MRLKKGRLPVVMTGRLPCFVEDGDLCAERAGYRLSLAIKEPPRTGEVLQIYIIEKGRRADNKLPARVL